MKRLRFILTGLFMSALLLPVKGELIIRLSQNSIEVQSTKAGVKGYQGCHPERLKEIPAFTFELYKRKGNPGQVCGANSAGKWIRVSTIESEAGRAVFPGLRQGLYRVVCYSGHAIGCVIAGATGDYPARSIVLEKESSSILSIGDEPHSSDAMTGKDIASGQLKVFPNPAQEELHIQLTNSELSAHVDIYLVDLLGRVVHRESQPIGDRSGSYQWTLRVADLPPGAYLVRLSDVQGLSLQEKVLIHNKH